MFYLKARTTFWSCLLDSGRTATPKSGLIPRALRWARPRLRFRGGPIYPEAGRSVPRWASRSRDGHLSPTPKGPQQALGAGDRHPPLASRVKDGSYEGPASGHTTQRPRFLLSVIVGAVKRRKSVCILERKACLCQEPFEPPGAASPSQAARGLML